MGIIVRGIGYLIKMLINGNFATSIPLWLVSELFEKDIIKLKNAALELNKAKKKLYP
jgi:hypothetical protein